MQSIVPSRRPSSSARASSAVRSGGSVRALVSYGSSSDRRVRQHQIVRRDLGRHAHAGGLRAAHLLDRAGGAQVGQVQPAAGQAGQRQVARDGDLLRLARDAFQAEDGGQRRPRASRRRRPGRRPRRGWRWAARPAASIRARGASGSPSGPRGRRPKTRRRRRRPCRPSRTALRRRAAWSSCPSAARARRRRGGPGSAAIRRPSRCRCSGRVSASAHSVVKPPAAAARVPVAIVSASSKPGSRRWQCRSTKPGATTKPDTSMTVSPFGVGALDEPIVRRSADRPTSSRPDAGSRMRPPTRRITPATR